MTPVQLADAIRAEIGRQRREGRIVTEVLVDSRAWNTLGRELKSGPFGGTQAVLFEGLPVALTIGCPPPGFEVCSLAPRD